MEELRIRLDIPVKKGLIPESKTLHQMPMCRHGRPTYCWNCELNGIEIDVTDLVESES